LDFFIREFTDTNRCIDHLLSRLCVQTTRRSDSKIDNAPDTRLFVRLDNTCDYVCQFARQ
jgi:hypothetical protein